MLRSHVGVTLRVRAARQPSEAAAACAARGSHGVYARRAPSLPLCMWLCRPPVPRLCVAGGGEGWSNCGRRDCSGCRSCGCCGVAVRRCSCACDARRTRWLRRWCGRRCSVCGGWCLAARSAPPCRVLWLPRAAATSATHHVLLAAARRPMVGARTLCGGVITAPAVGSSQEPVLRGGDTQAWGLCVCGGVPARLWVCHLRAKWSCV